MPENTPQAAKQRPPDSPQVKLLRRESLITLNRNHPDYLAVLRAWQDPLTQKGQYNPLQVYDEMLMDARVQQAVGMVKSAVASLGWSVEVDQLPARLKQEIPEFVNWNMRNQDGPLEEALDHFMSCFEYGWSGTAQYWGTHSAWPRKWVVTRWQPLPPSVYKPLVADETGRVDGFTGPGSGENVFTRREQYIYIRWNPKFGSPYGRSQLSAAYEAWWNKNTLRRMRNLGLDRFGAPFIAIRVPPTTDQDKRKALLGVIDNFHAHGGGVIDDNNQIELIRDGAAGGAGEFQRALDFENQEILAAIAGATLNATQSDRGSFAQARVHMEMFLYIVAKLSSTLEAALNEQFVRPLITLNYGEAVARKVNLKWGSVQSISKDVLDMVVQLVTSGIALPSEPWIRERLELPEAPPELAQQSSMGMGMGIGAEPAPSEALPDDWSIDFDDPELGAALAQAMTDTARAYASMGVGVRYAQ